MKLTVDHQIGDLSEGATYVMTLKDKRVDSSDSEDDALENEGLQSVFK